MLGRLLGRLLSGGEVICLRGELGAGKTVFVRGLADGLGCPPAGVASPTYVIERICPGRELLLRHMDAYRLSGAEEFEAADLATALGAPGTVVALEWAGRVEDCLPAERIEADLEARGDQERAVAISGLGAEAAALVERLRLAAEADPDAARMLRAAVAGAALPGAHPGPGRPAPGRTAARSSHEHREEKRRNP